MPPDMLVGGAACSGPVIDGVGKGDGVAGFSPGASWADTAQGAARINIAVKTIFGLEIAFIVNPVCSRSRLRSRRDRQRKYFVRASGFFR
jgi:hypothetical protein